MPPFLGNGILLQQGILENLVLQEVFVQSNNSFCATTIDDSRKNYKIIVAFDFDMWGPSRWQVGAMG